MHEVTSFRQVKVNPVDDLRLLHDHSLDFFIGVPNRLGLLQNVLDSERVLVLLLVHHVFSFLQVFLVFQKLLVLCEGTCLFILLEVHGQVLNALALAVDYTPEVVEVVLLFLHSGSC